MKRLESIQKLVLIKIHKNQKLRSMNFKTFLYLPLLMMAISIGITSCEEEDSSEPSVILDADAGDDMTVEVGEEVVLDGSNSSASEGSFDFEWSFSSIPNESSAELQDANTADPSFTPDVEGDYMVELTITNGEQEDTDEVTVTAEIGDTPKEISENINENTTWTDRLDDPETPDYHVTSSIEVNADLTIDPGVMVHFDEDVFMAVKDGALIAEGTSDNRITLTSSNEAGEINWGGVFITSSDSRNIIAYTDIKYAAGAEKWYGVDKKSGIGLSNEGKLKLKYSTISNSDGYGLYVRYGELVEFENNEFNDNEAQAIGVDMTQAAMIDGNTTFSNNTYAVEIFESESSEGDELTYTNLSGNASYYVTGDLEVNAELTIDPGARFEFKQDKKITVTSDGMLTANAEDNETVVFTSAKADAGIYWKGIEIKSADARNELNNVEISYAGNSNWWFGEDKMTALALKTDGEIKLKNSEISNSNGYGMYARYGEVTEFVNNTFTDNGGPAIGLYANLAGMIDEGTSFSGNGWDGVEIFKSTLDESATWVNLDGSAKYGVSGDLTIKNALDIDLGAVFEFDVDKELYISSEGGSLNAQGTETSKIVFTRAVEGEGWSGIHFRSSSTLNKLDHVEVLYAGSKDVWLGQDVYTAISGDNNAVLEMTNSKVANSGGYGVYWQDGTTINDISSTGANNEFVNNANDDVFIEN
ncbi:MAG: right-handed parallel beta-helix repeat-containing protein [Bacteroidales bacterium]|nr:right-handed parallel beta-helix repeat-containing protein [Bacteroidales bacterium]